MMIVSSLGLGVPATDEEAAAGVAGGLGGTDTLSLVAGRAACDGGLKKRRFCWLSGSL